MGSGDEETTSAFVDLHVFCVHPTGTRSPWTPWTTSNTLSAESDTRVLGRGRLPKRIHVRTRRRDLRVPPLPEQRGLWPWPHLLSRGGRHRGGGSIGAGELSTSGRRRRHVQGLCSAMGCSVLHQCRLRPGIHMSGRHQ